MTDSILDDPALEPMFFWYSIDCFNRIHDIGIDKVMDAIEEAQAFSLENPLFQRDSHGKFPEVDLGEGFGKRSGPYVAVLMSAFLVYEMHDNFGDDAPIPDSRLLRMADNAFEAWNVLGFRGPGEDVEDV